MKHPKSSLYDKIRGYALRILDVQHVVEAMNYSEDSSVRVRIPFTFHR